MPGTYPKINYEFKTEPGVPNLDAMDVSDVWQWWREHRRVSEASLYHVFPDNATLAQGISQRQW